MLTYITTTRTTRAGYCYGSCNTTLTLLWDNYWFHDDSNHTAGHWCWLLLLVSQYNNNTTVRLTLVALHLQPHGHSRWPLVWLLQHNCDTAVRLLLVPLHHQQHGHSRWLLLWLLQHNNSASYCRFLTRITTTRTTRPLALATGMTLATQWLHCCEIITCITWHLKHHRHLRWLLLLLLL